jgi:MFS family permease
MLAFAAALIIAGNLGGLFGRKRVFVTGAALFGLASVAAGMSQSGAELIAARVVQREMPKAPVPAVPRTAVTGMTGPNGRYDTPRCHC